MDGGGKRGIWRDVGERLIGMKCMVFYTFLIFELNRREIQGWNNMNIKAEEIL